MIQISHFSFPHQLLDLELNRFVSLLPNKMQKEVWKYRRWQDRYANLFGKLILLKGLLERGYPKNVLESIELTDFGKPYIPSGIHFNISHSGESVICAFSEKTPIGIDIEEKKAVDIYEFDGIFSDLEWNTLVNDPDPKENFYRFWTTKESVIKAVGKGLSLVLKEVMVTAFNNCTYKDINYNIRLLNIRDGYACAFASNCSQDYRVDNVKLADLEKLI